MIYYLLAIQLTVATIVSIAYQNSKCLNLSPLNRASSRAKITAATATVEKLQLIEQGNTNRSYRSYL